MIVFPSPPLRYVCVKYDHEYVSSVVLSSLMTVNPSGAPEFIPGFSGVRVAQSLVFCVMYCRSLFVLFLLAIVLSVLFFYLRLLITPLISSNFFFNHGIVPRVTLGEQEQDNKSSHPFLVVFACTISFVLSSVLWIIVIFFYLPLYCLLFNLKSLVTALVSSNFF